MVGLGKYMPCDYGVWLPFIPCSVAAPFNERLSLAKRVRFSTDPAPPKTQKLPILVKVHHYYLTIEFDQKKVLEYYNLNVTFREFWGNQ